jgi:hypothetical protein
MIMQDYCYQVGRYIGVGIAGTLFGTASGTMASYSLSLPLTYGLVFGAISGGSFGLITKGSIDLLDTKKKWVPYAIGTIASIMIGYSAHELTKDRVEFESTFFKHAATTYAIGLAAFTLLNMIYCCYKMAPKEKPQERYLLSSEELA